ncbi:hypothetical protein [Candidatus Sulfurimonas baltica]|uniref:Lipoprotein n=1 Tax=Candidatus Sulfurimonas baltica TaxID=2740404 RepID=A0A7S7LSS7_9BACT|nr:hypothetical protein [Candidatus Sulfurimonas baltica]QOY50874.1 hypothetical protein HUE88_10955 [Candidatus Sulfurimonas baltica]
MNRINNLTSVFHIAIIAMFLLSFSGCGHKADPYYLEEAPQSDENVKFIIKKPSHDSNESINGQ